MFRISFTGAVLLCFLSVSGYADWTYYFPPNGLASSRVSDILKDSQGRLWFSTGHKKGSSISENGAGISVFDRRVWTTYTTAQGLPSNNVNALAIDSSGNVWAATEAGIARFDGSSWTTLNNTPLVRDVAIESNGTLWFATHGSGVLRYSGGSFSTFTNSNSGLGNNNVTSIAISSTGVKYFGTDGGYVYELNGSTWTQKTLTPFASGANTVWTVFADSSNNIWAGTHGAGIYVKPAGSSSFATNYTTASGLGNNFVFGIGEDVDGALWFVFGVFGTNSQVISKFASGTFTNFAQSDGFPSSNMISMLFDDRMGNLAKREQWFGTVTNGAARFGFPHLLSGWPVTIPGTGGTNYVKHSSPALADLDGDGVKEIVVGSLSGNVFAYRADGTLMWQAKAPSGSSINSSPAVGDLNNDGKPEVVVGVGTNEPGHNPEHGGIVVFSNTGVVQWEKRTFDADGNNFGDGVFSTPAIADLDADGYKEIIIGAWDQQIYALQWDGSPFLRIDNDGDERVDEDGVGDITPAPYKGDGCPGLCGVDDDGDFQVDEGNLADDDEDGRVEEDPPEWPRNNEDSVWSSPAVADLQGDGDMEIVIGGDSSPGGEFPAGGTLRVMNSDGSRENSRWHKGTQQVIWSSPALADLDNDGKLEIIVGNGHFYTGVPSKLYVFRSDGSGYLSSDGTFASLPDYVFTSPAVGDLNGDGSPDIVAAAHNGYVYAWDKNGNLLPGWPVEPNPGVPNADIASSPVIGDVDGDGSQEVVLGVSNTLYAINKDGKLVPGFGTGESTVMSYHIGNSAAIGDIDNDGWTDIILVVPFTTTGPDPAGTRIYRWMGGTWTSANWPLFRKNADRNGVYAPVAKDSLGGNMSIQASSDTPIIVEKAEYIDAFVNGEKIHNAFGSNSVGSNATSLNWYFPNVNTQRYRIQLLLMNPDERNSASVQVNYLIQGGSPVQDSFTLGPATRKTITVNDDSRLANKDISVVVTSNIGIVSEKLMSWSGTIQGQTVNPIGGAGTTGTPQALTQWYLAEGSTAGWKLWYVVMNPSSSSTGTVTFNYLLEGAAPVSETFSLGPLKNKTVFVNSILPFANVSLWATSNIPIAVERTMHWNANPGGEEINDIGGHTTMGIERPRKLWYLAEGSTAGWKLWVLLMNPNAATARATVTWLREGAAPLVEQYDLAPNSRKTIEVRRIPGLEFANISVKVESDLDIIVERAMYWNSDMSFGRLVNVDGHNSPGVNALSTNWYMASGSTNLYRTYVLFMNTSNRTANVTLKLMTEDGRQIVRRYQVFPNSRRTVQLNHIWGSP